MSFYMDEADFKKIAPFLPFGGDNLAEFQDITEGMRSHPCRSKSEEEARFVFKRVSKTSWSHQRVLALPPRPPERPYLVMYHTDCHEPELWKRLDFVFFAMDLRHYDPRCEPHCPPLPGVTMSPPIYFQRRSYDPHAPPRFFLALKATTGALNHRRQGDWHNTVRDDLNASFWHPLRGSDKRRVLVCIKDGVRHRFREECQGIPYEDFFDTAYMLMPSGGFRWCHRLAEAIGACAIPVVMSDGLTLPFEEIIDWTQAAVRIEEQAAKEPYQLLARLPSDPETIRAMRSRVCEINRLYFDTRKKRFSAVLQSAMLWLSNHGGARNESTVPAWPPRLQKGTCAWHK